MSAARATPEQALARTTALIDEHLFGGRAAHDAIAKGLMATRVRLMADERNASSRAGQAAVVTAFQLIARMGMAVELSVPETSLIADAPALRAARTLRSGLLDLGADLIPGAVATSEITDDAELTLAFGDTPTDTPAALKVSVSDLGARIAPSGQPGSRIETDFPLGALASGPAAAAIALYAALPNIEAATGVRRSQSQMRSPGPPVEIELARLFPGLSSTKVDLGALDIVSAGAVTNSLVNALLWLPGARGQLSVLDDDAVDWDNLNRCVQFRARDVTQEKVDVLADAATATMPIEARHGRFPDPDEHAGPDLARRVAVGVDDIRARWWVQRHWPAQLYVAATSHYEATVTTHRPGGPCAGCAHPEAGPPPSEIPTISFVSYWGGLLQVCALLAEPNTSEPARRTTVFPFALGEDKWCRSSEISPLAACAIACPVSRHLRRTL